MKKCIAFLSLLLMLLGCLPGTPQDGQTGENGDKTPPDEIPPHSDSIKIASFNIQVFGQTKAGKPEVMDILAQIIRRYDIVAIQEIRNIAETAIITLKDKVNEDGSSYAVVTGPRVGRTRSKEQYAYMYNTETIDDPTGAYTYDDDGDGNGVNDIDDSIHPNDLFEREPYVAHFKVKWGTFDFVLINIHTKPDHAETEIGYLPGVITDALTRIGETDVICLGDFNADGSYFDEDTYLSVFPADRYYWLVPNSADTNLAASDRTYDRIVTTLSMDEDYADTWGVFRFDQEYDFSSPTMDPDDVSDHYPVWAEFYIDMDTD